MSRRRRAEASTDIACDGVVAFGDAAFRRAMAGAEEARVLASALRRDLGTEATDGVRDIVSGWSSVVVTFDPDRSDADALCRWLATSESNAATLDPPRTHTIPTVFDGPDLEEVCASTGLSADDLAEAFAASELHVAMVGFSPGFGYLEGLPDILRAVPRRDSPRTRVGAGALALAAGFAAFYPQATPGGWQLIGSSRTQFFDPATPPFSLLAPGDKVRIVPRERHVGSTVMPNAGGIAGDHASSPVRDDPVFRVERSGSCSIVQDGGRVGWAHLGVPSAGPADPISHGLANLLVGNDHDAPAIEVTGGGLVLRALRPVFVAVVGPGAHCSVDGREVPSSQVIPIDIGQSIAIHPAELGLRTTVAWAGGVGAAPVLGSRATDVLTWTGPGLLEEGTMLGVAGTIRPMADHLIPSSSAPALLDDPLLVRILAGPDAAWFPNGSMTLDGLTFRVDVRSDRVGVRLSPFEHVVLRTSGECSSEPMVTGAIQVPPDGVPVVLGPDHATLGGYPVAAVVISADLELLGQVRAGDLVRLAVVDAEGAADARRARARLFSQAVSGRYPTTAG